MRAGVGELNRFLAYQSFVADETYWFVRFEDYIPGFKTSVIAVDGYSVWLVPSNYKSGGNELERIHGWARN